MVSNLQRSLWFPIALSIVVHLVLIATFFQLKVLGWIFAGESAKRLPELQKLAQDQEQRINEFLKDTAVLEVTAVRTEYGGSQISGLESSRYAPTGEISLPENKTEKIRYLTSPTGKESAIEAAEKNANRPLLPPGDPSSRPHSAVSKDKVGIPVRALRPAFSPDLFQRVPISYTPPPIEYDNSVRYSPRVASSQPDLPALPILSDSPRIYPLDDDLDVKLEIYRDQLEGADYFRLTLNVRPESKLKPFSKDNLFLVDVSLSVSRDKLKTNFESVMRALRSLPAGDRYNIVLFHLKQESVFREFRQFAEEDVKLLEERLVRPDRAVLTDISNGIYRTLEKFQASSDRLMNVYIISDGMATAGRASLKGITSKYSNSQTWLHSLFTYNSGRPANLHLLQMISFMGKGMLYDAENETESPILFDELMKSFSRPVLRSVDAQYVAPAVSEIFPTDLPNLHRDAPLRIYGKCTQGREFVLRIKGESADGARDILIRTELPTPDQNLREIAREWAKGRVYQLLESYFHKNGGEEAMNQVRTLSVRHGIALPFDIDK